jgi:1-deoxy-D-xylulose-5-phosphate synthase
MRPVTALYSTFLQRAFDQLLHDVALQGLPLVVAVDRAGFVGADGATHHGLYDVAFCASIPGARVLAPTTQAELRTALRVAFAASGLTLIRYPRDKAPAQSDALPLLAQNDAFDVFGDPNAACALITYGRLFFEACKAPGIRQAKVIKLKQILPLDFAAVRAVLGCERVLFFEEGMRTGGVGERFGAALLAQGFGGTFALHALEGFARHAPVQVLLAEHGLDAAAMETALCG